MEPHHGGLMATMKNVILPILEDIAQGDDTRMGLHKRCEHLVPAWFHFKRVFSFLIADGLVEQTGAKPGTGGAIAIFGLTEVGRDVVQSLVG
jgi:hypothetical protein